MNRNIQLPSTENRFKSLFEQAPVSIQIISPDGRTIEVNRAWENLWQSGEGGLKEFVLSEYNILKDKQLEELGITAYLLRAFAGESVQIPPILYDTSRVGIYGRSRYVSAHAHPVLGNDGTVQEVMLIHEDISERIEVERGLKLSEQRFKSLVLASTQIVWTTSADGPVVEDSPSWRAYTGQTFDEWKQYGWINVIHPEDRELTLRSWGESVANRQIYLGEYRIRRHDGEYRWTAVRAVPILNDDGSIREWVGTNTDIQEFKLAQASAAQRLIDEKRQSALLLKVANASRHMQMSLSVDECAKLLVEEVRDILQTHQAVVSLTKNDQWLQTINAVSLSDKYAAYRTYTEKTDGSGIYAEVCRTNKVMRLTQSELEQHPSFKRFGKHSSSHPVMRGWLAVPLIDRNGKNIGLIQASDKLEGEFTAEDEAVLIQLAAIASNGFENSRLYDALQEQDKRKDEFLAMLAHELRNPLAPISAAAEFLSAASDSNSSIKKTSEIVSRQVRHMTGLVDDLLDVSRVTRGLVQLSHASVDVKKVVADAVEQTLPTMEAKNHHLIVELAAESIHVLGDHKRLVQVISNLLNNAAKYTPVGGAIVVKAVVSNCDVVISVSDNGIGIAEDSKESIFELFAQAERTPDRSQGGLGIGLALVKSLVGLHGGASWASSEGIGQGAQFFVSLPLLGLGHADQSVIDKDGASASKSRQLRILVVDDNVDAAEILGMYLETMGHEATLKYSSSDALLLARTTAFDVCILDIGLPGMDGNELATSLRLEAKTSKSLMIALTGYGQETDRAKSKAAGFDHHMVKPVDMTKLLSLLVEAGIH